MQSMIIGCCSIAETKLPCILINVMLKEYQRKEQRLPEHQRLFLALIHHRQEQ